MLGKTPDVTSKYVQLGLTKTRTNNIEHTTKNKKLPLKKQHQQQQQQQVKKRNIYLSMYSE